MSDNTTVKFIAVMKAEQEQIAQGAMIRPNADNYAIQAGKYQGIQFALDALESIMCDTYEKEKHS